MAGLSVSCSFLDTDVYGSMDKEAIYRDEASCLAGLYGVYDGLQREGTYGCNLWADLDAGTDILVWNRGYGANEPRICLYNYNNTLAALEKSWTDLYAGINRANDYIDIIQQRTDEECGSAENKAMFLGEAKALRALYYMNLVAFWGEVPLRTEPSRDLSVQQKARASQEEIYAQIISDLLDAEKGCRPADELNAPGRIAKTTAQALLARAYMWQAGYPVYADTWDDALYWARQVRDSGLHHLYQDEDFGDGEGVMNGYQALFKNMCLNQYDLNYRESMFEVEFYGNGVTDKTDEAGGVGLYLGVMQGLQTDEDVPFAYAWYDATNYLFHLYETGDARQWWNIADYHYTNDGETATEIAYTEEEKADKDDGNPGKWRAKYDPVRPWARNNSSINFPVMRYSDVLLMIAECANEVNNGPTQEAVDAVNEVRARANASQISLSTYSNVRAFRSFVRDERTRELCYEVPRRMELRRFGEDYFLRQVQRMGREEVDTEGGYTIGYEENTNNYKWLAGQNVTSKFVYFPIPQRELNTNPTCGQNERW